MAFQTRCPECKAKLRFDEQPDPDEAIECPRCGHVYEGSEARPLKKKVKALAGGGDDRPRMKKTSPDEKPKGKAPKKRKVKKKKANPFILWMLLIGVLVFAPAVGWVGYKLFWSTGKVGGLLSYVPAECNLLRGCDVQRLSKYIGFKSQLDAAMTGPFGECRDELAKAASAEKPEAFLDYALSAKIVNGSASATMYVFQTLKPFDSAALTKNLGGSEQNVDGQTVQKLGVKTGAMNGAYVYCPTDRHIVVIASQGDQSKMLKSSLAAKGTPKETSMLGKLGDCGVKTTRANIWTLMRPEGDLKGKPNIQMGEPLKQALPALQQRLATATMMGTYMYFGSKGIKFGVAIETDSIDSADTLAKTLMESELGKGDDGDWPRDLLMLFPMARNKDFAEFKANLVFRATGKCAYLESVMAYEKAIQMLSFFNKVDMWEGDNNMFTGFRR